MVGRRASAASALLSVRRRDSERRDQDGAVKTVLTLAEHVRDCSLREVIRMVIGVRYCGWLDRAQRGR